MEITSVYFVFLAVISVFIFYIISPKYRTIYLVIISCGFVATFNYYILLYVLVYSWINYFIGLKIPHSRFKIALFRTGIFINLTQLVLLKYASFAIDPIINIFNNNINISKLSEIIIPVGISYFTLQGIGYLTNIKMGWEKPEKKYFNFLLYIIFFPKFLSGPIERSNHFLPKLNSYCSFSEQQTTSGLRIILLGLFKKVVIANQLVIVVNTVYSDLNSFGGYELWAVVLILPLCLYFDFSGYTDIAVGLAKMYGIDLLPNFNQPFLSENVTTFWKRFHMSLSLWFNDYLFKQVSFRYRRWGKYASVFAVFVTFTLFGIWHGAGWNFMVLGFIQAFALNYEYFTKPQRTKIFSKMPDFFRKWSGRLFTYLFFAGSLIFFFSPDITTAFSFFSKLFHSGTYGNQYLGVPVQMLMVALVFSIILLVYEVFNNDFIVANNKIENYWNKNKPVRLVVYYIAIALILYSSGGTQQFIYSQF
jgi:alginate O-acetyltransferase complex protein AlgI